MTNPTFISPIDYTSEVEPESVGINSKKLEKLVQVFEGQVRVEKLHPSAQLVVLRHGKVVLNRAIGISRGKSINPDTPFLTFSVSKALTGICLHKLIEDGLVDINAKVADYWPGFGCKGKEDARIKHVFLHQAGIPAPHLYSQILVWPFWRLVTLHVAKSAAVFPPGTKSAYHLLNYGFIIGEVVRRVTGQSISKYLKENFLDPLGMGNSYMPLPYREYLNSPRLETDERQLKTAVTLFNFPHLRHALMPAATLHSSAKDLAIFYQMLLNGGTYAGKNFLVPETIAFAISEGCAGFDETTHSYHRWAYGFHLGGKIETPEGEKYLGMGSGASQSAFGHFGMASSLAFADPVADLVFMFTCSKLIDSGKVRNQPLLEALWESII